MEGLGDHRVLRHRARTPGPWANGGGITYEVARSPEDASDFDWRLSIAEIASDGPFSPYPGVDRILLLLRGTMDLVIDGTRYDVPPFVPLAFAGEARVESHLVDGPTMDFNVMTRRGRATAVVDVLAGPTVVIPPPDNTPPDNATVIALILDGERTLDGLEQPLSAWDCLVSGSATHLHGHGMVACVTLRDAGLRRSPTGEASPTRRADGEQR